MNDLNERQEEALTIVKEFYETEAEECQYEWRGENLFVKGDSFELLAKIARKVGVLTLVPEGCKATYKAKNESGDLVSVEYPFNPCIVVRLDYQHSISL